MMSEADNTAKNLGGRSRYTFVRKMNRRIRSVNSTNYALFLSTIYGSGNGTQKSESFNKAVPKGCFFTFPCQILGGLETFLPYTLAQSKNSGSNLLMKVHH